jgi:hypothetical protein
MPVRVQAPLAQPDIPLKWRWIATLGVGGAGGDAEGGKDGKEGKDHGQHLPAKRCRLTDTMKSMVGELVLLSNECCRFKNEKVSIRQLYISRFRMN